MDIGKITGKGTTTVSTLTDGTATLTGGSLTGVKLGSLTTAGVVTLSGTDGTLVSTASNAVGGMTLVATASPSAAANFTINNLSPATYYKLVMHISNTGTGAEILTINGDSGSNYTVGTPYSNGTSMTYYTAVRTNFNWIGGTISGSFANYEIYFSTTPGDNKKVVFDGMAFNYAPTGNGSYLCGGYYAGASDLSSITFGISSGTITGTARLYKYN